MFWLGKFHLMPLESGVKHLILRRLSLTIKSFYISAFISRSEKYWWAALWYSFNYSSQEIEKYLIAKINTRGLKKKNLALPIATFKNMHSSSNHSLENLSILHRLILFSLSDDVFKKKSKYMTNQIFFCICKLTVVPVYVVYKVLRTVQIIRE